LLEIGNLLFLGTCLLTFVILTLKAIMGKKTNRPITKEIKWLIINGLGILLLTLSLVFSYAPLPKDRELVKQFETQKPKLEKLLSMLKKDQNLRIVGLWGIRTAMPKRTQKSDSLDAAEIDQKRLNSYQALLRQAGLSAAIQDPEEHRFPFASRGFSTKGWRVAFVYRTQPVTKEDLIGSIDLFPEKKRGKMEWVKAYRPLGGNWYIFIVW